MENRKFVKFLIPIVRLCTLQVFILGLFIFNPGQVSAYWIDTHAFLTKEAAKFYSEKVATSSINSFVDYLVDGSRKEDDVPRWMNHFYDPIYDRGLTMDSKIDPFYVLGNWNRSKDWVASSDLQNEVKYKVPTVIASILSVIQQGKISNLTTETDFTWDKALYFWINGEKEKAMFALGHILHLIQDASVPDHTRNDPHPEGSIYEKWTSQFTLDNPDNKLLPKLANKNLISLDNLGSYFDELAKYSNNNFYSKDTIGIQSGYDLPQLNFENYQAINGLYYLVSRDSSDKEYFLIAKKSLRSIVLVNKSDMILDDNLVKHDYWSLLSPKAVQYSASVIDLFFKEAERLKDDPQFVKKESFFAQVVDVAKELFSNVVGAIKDNAQIQDQNLLASVSLDGDVQSNEQGIIESEPTNNQIDQNNLTTENENIINNPEEKASTEGVAKEESEIIPGESWQKLNQETASSTQEELLENNPETNNAQKPIIQTCSFETSKIATHKDLLINEVAWMGGIKSSSDEWIELKNISNSILDISNWQILDKEEQIKISLPINTNIPAGGFLLLERTNDDSAPNVKADIIYTGALSNSNEGLRLFNNECNLIDEVVANSDWSAGDSSTKRTMERQADLTWWTYNGSGEGIGDLLILGTPRKENSVKIIYGGGGSGNVVSPTNENQSNVQDANQPSKILISEIQITGGTGKTNNDFVEIYNPNDSRVNLKGYRLVKRTKTGTTDTGIKSWTDDAYIEAKSFYLWANSDYADITTAPDISTTASLASDNGVALRYGAEDTGTIIDSVAWGAAENAFIESNKFPTNPAANESIQRKIQNGIFVDTDNNAGDFESRICPSPKSQSRSCGTSTNQAPSAFFVLSTTTPKTSEEIIFDGSSSTDIDGQIILYEWNFGDSQSASTTQATTTHSYALSGNYRPELIIYDNNNATSTTSFDLLVASSTPTSVSNFLAQYDKPNRQINLSWDASQDSSGATTTLNYRITDISSVPVLSDINTPLTIATTSVSQLGRDYVFEIKAIDKDGLSSDTATTTISVPNTSIEDVEYFLLNKTETSGTMSLSDRIFKPLATGVVDSIAFNIGVSYNQNIPGTSSNVDINMYEWDGDTQSSGVLVAKSEAGTVYSHTSGFTLNFSGENKVVLDGSKYYYFEINTTSSGLTIYWHPYIVIKAVSTGTIEISSPIHNHVYENQNIDFGFKYLEPFNNKYGNLIVEVKDFYTDELVSSQTISLSDSEKTIGWHEISGNLNINRSGYFKLNISLSDTVKSESYFSIFGAVPVEGKLLDQENYSSSVPEAQFSGQVFRPAISGWASSLTIMAIANGSNVYHGYNYWSVYEWNGDGNSLIGSQGSLLATTSPAYLTSDSFMEMSWNFGDEGVYLDSSKYYFLTLNKETNGGQVPRLTMKMTDNGSLIDGRLIAQYIDQSDLYLIINKKVSL